jgi:serine phosphatase RsbU (regulator of sigma subunit)
MTTIEAPRFDPGPADGADGAGPWGHFSMAPSGDDAAAGFFNWHLRTGEVICDDETYRMHGLVPETTTPAIASFLAQVPPQDMDQLTAVLDPMMRSIGDFIIEYRVRWPNGELHTLETRGRIIAGPDCLPLRAMGILADVTRRHEAEHAARVEAQAVARMQTLTAGLAAASTLAEVERAVERALPALDAHGLFIADTDKTVQVLLSCGVPIAEDSINAPDGPLRTAIAYDTPLFYGDSAELCERFPRCAARIPETGREAWAFLPMSGMPRMSGACVISYAQAHEFDRAERALLILAASAIGQAVYRARNHDTEHTMAMALQDGMLPKELKFGPAVSAARRYEAATNGILVGGDWFDSVPLPDGSTILVIGDVEGHNVHAAGMMYRMRTTVRAYAVEGHPVDQILARANTSVLAVNDEADNPLFATCLVVRIDPATRTITSSRAGHVPLVVVPPGEPATVPRTEVGVPLGIVSRAEAGDFPVWSTPYEPGTRLLMCTDGLLESIDSDLDIGLDRTLAALDKTADAPLEQAAARLLDANRPHGAWQDDVALLLVQLD